MKISSGKTHLHLILPALGAAVLVTLVLSLAIVLIRAPGTPRAPAKAEDHWCAQLLSGDTNERTAAFRSLHRVWEKLAEKEMHSPVNDLPATPDKNIQTVMDAIQRETDSDCRQKGQQALMSAPPKRVPAAWVEDWLLEQAAMTSDPLKKFHFGRILCRRYWRQGQPPSERTMIMLDQALNLCREPIHLEYLLRSIENLNSDLRPLENTIKRLTIYTDPHVSDRARRLMLAMKKPLQPKWRQDGMGSF